MTNESLEKRVKRRDYSGRKILGILGSLALAGCSAFSEPKPDILGEYRTTEEKSTHLIEKEEEEINRQIILEDKLDIYESEIDIRKFKDYDLITYTIGNTDPRELQQALEEQFGKIVGGKISLLESTNTILIRVDRKDSGEEIYKAIRETISSLDVMPPQIMIDVDVVRVFADYTRDVRAILKAESLGGETLSPSISVDLPGAHLRSPQRADIGARWGIIAESGKTIIEAALDQLESYGFAESLAKPSLLVTNRKKARVALIEEIPIPKEVTVSGAIVIATEYKEVPNYLEITPSARDNGIIGMQIKSGMGSVNPTGPLQVPTITRRETEIENVYLRQGQTLAIAGFTNYKTISIVRKVPILGDIPVLGELFRGTDVEKSRDMILFLVTPYYVDVRK